VKTLPVPTNFRRLGGPWAVWTI